MKLLAKLLVCMLVAGLLWSCDNTNCNGGYTTYKAEIFNNSSSEITDIHLAMVGVEKKVTLDKLAPGATTEFYEFKLKKPVQGQPLPPSYGDYSGDYMQKGEQKSIHVSSPAKEISIKIDDQSFSIEKMAVN